MTNRRVQLGLLTALLLGGASPVAFAGPQPAARVEINADDYPDAKCNDNTQASYYVRGAGPDGAISGRKWLIFLHGGGSCASDDECAERWYDRNAGNDGIIGFHGNMTTSTDAVKDFNGEGILDVDGVDNRAEPVPHPLAGFNRVMIPYCTSDSYTGKNTRSRLVNYAAYVGRNVTIGNQTVTISNPDDLIPPLRSIRFSGRWVVEAVADLLMQGGIATGRKTNANTLGYVPPPSADIDEVVISGSSAGGFGVIRNLDNMAKIIHDAARDVKVFGVIDAADAVGVLPDSSITGDPDFANSSFYEAISSAEADLSCQDDFPLTRSNKCFSPVFVLKNYVETPHFVAQQAYDGVIHGGVVQGIAQLLSASIPAATAEGLATQYVRNRISTGARELGGGVTHPQHVGYFIPNYTSPKHQLMAEDLWFFNTPQAFANQLGSDPRLGTDAQSTLGLPRSLACFRFQVTGQGSGCVDGADAKVINATYPANPLLATFDAPTATLTLPYVRLSNNTFFKNVSVVVSPLGSVLVNDLRVGAPGSLNEYNPTTNVLSLPMVSVGGTTYERVSVSGPGLRVLSFEPVTP